MARLDFEKTMDRLMRMIKAGYPVIYLVSYEEARVFDCIARIVNRLRANEPVDEKEPKDKKTILSRWAQGLGLQTVKLDDRVLVPESRYWLDAQGLPPNVTTELVKKEEADWTINQLRLSQEQKHSTLVNSVTVFFDLHPHLAQYPGGPPGPLVRPLRNLADLMRKHYDAGRGQALHKYQTIIIVAPTAETLSRELLGDIAVLDFPLPEVPELKGVVQNMIDRELLLFP